MSQYSNTNSLNTPALSPLTIIVLSNSQLLQVGLTTLLAEHFPVAFIEAHSTDTYPEVDSSEPGYWVILLDSGIGHNNTLTLIRHWRKTPANIFVVVLELSDNIELIVACIEAGANGYLLKGSSVEDLVRTIEDVCRGLPSCSPQVVAEIFQRLSRLSGQKDMVAYTMEAGTLTRREMEILHYIVQGYSNKVIAQELVIEVRTVKHHVHNILSKLDVQHRWDAARFATQQGWFKEQWVLGLTNHTNGAIQT